MHVADMLAGFLNIRENLEVPTFYFGLANDAEHKDWAIEYVTDCMYSKFLDKSMIVPWANPLPKDDPNSVTPPMPVPQFTILSWDGSTRKSLIMPAHVIAQWKSHPTFGPKLDEYVAKHKLDGSIVQAEPSPLKRKGDDVKVEQGKTKCLKQESKGEQAEEKCVVKLEVVNPTTEFDKMPGLTHEFVLTSVEAPKNLSVGISSTCQMFINNPNDQEITIPMWTFFAGFKSGKWGSRSNDADQSSLGDFEYLYQLINGNDTVIFEGKMSTLMDVIEQRRAMKPDNADVAYHTINDSPTPEHPGFFTLSKSASISFTVNSPVVKMEPGTKTTLPQGHAACVLPAKAWMNLNMVSVVWTVGWTISCGPRPRRPSIYLMQDLVIPPMSVVSMH